MNSKKISYFKESINQEAVINLDFSYLSIKIHKWWDKAEREMSIHYLKFQLINLLLDAIHKEDLFYFDRVGARGIAAVCIENIFLNDNPQLSLIVHEAFSELFLLNDIKYPYEDHKKLYLKPSGEIYRDWGNGYGEITPHSDDLYEELDVDFLSLTVCRDYTHTPTILYFPKDILANFNDVELERLLAMRAVFVSGKNVNILKKRERSLIEYSKEHGFKFFLDFRIDKDTGERMLAKNPEDQVLINKMRNNILSCQFVESKAKTGTFLIVANYKVLHARAQMNMDKKIAAEISMNTNFQGAPRLLYRSKGPNSKYLNQF